MTSNNPLSYDGLKVILLYMEANLRYHLALRIPSIRIVEKLVPLRFDRICFDTNTTRLNKTLYRVGIYREYPDGYDVPKHHQKINENGGDCYDLTEHGFDIHHVNQVITPGDVNIPFNRDRPAEAVNNVRQVWYERHLRVYQAALTTRQASPGDGPVDEEDTPPLEMHHLGAPINPEAGIAGLEQQLLDRIKTYSVKKLTDGVQYFRTCLIPYSCRRDNTPPPYIPWILLTIGGKPAYRHRYNIKLQEAMKKVNMVLFGGRKCIHRTLLFSVMQRHMVIKLPEGFRVSIRDLFVTGNIQLTCTALEKIVEESSYPLRSLTMVDDVFNATHYDNEIVKKVTVLNIKPRIDLGQSCLPLLLSLNNQTVNLKCVSGRFTIPRQYRLMAQWIDNWKDVGTSLSYEIIGDINVEYLLQQITHRLIGSRLQNRVLMPITNGTNLEVECIQIRKPHRPIGEQRWRVQMKVLAGEDMPDEQVQVQ